MDIKRQLLILLGIFISGIMFASGCFAADSSSSASVRKGLSVQSQQKSAAKINAKPFTLVLFWSDGCPYCIEEKVFLAEIASRFPSMTVKDYEVWNDRQNLQLMDKVAKAYNLKLQGVPVTFIGKKGFSGFSSDMKQPLLDEMKRCSIEGCANPLDKVSGMDSGAKDKHIRQKGSDNSVCTVGSSDKGCE
jgi:thiol-disulfide isomerase/thioredoxin